MEPSAAQCLIINAPESMELIKNSFYDRESGKWDINSISGVLPIAMILQSGSIVPTREVIRQ